MEHRVPSRAREIAGATLTISTTGGYSVLVDGDYIGYLHVSQGDQFNAYQRVAGGTDKWLGKFAVDDGVRAVMGACGRAAPPNAGQTRKARPDDSHGRRQWLPSSPAADQSTK